MPGLHTPLLLGAALATSLMEPAEAGWNCHANADAFGDCISSTYTNDCCSGSCASHGYDGCYFCDEPGNGGPECFDDSAAHRCAALHCDQVDDDSGECHSHSSCSGDTYCDSNHNCFDCDYVRDHSCDALDGDCSTCTSASPPPGGGSRSCDNTCRYANDGECDDGSQGGTPYCELGTDSNDCGGCGGGPPPPHGGAGTVTQQNCAVGGRVYRGPDWHWDDQDGGRGGRITDCQADDGWAHVDWDSGGGNAYEIGADGDFSLSYDADSHRTPAPTPSHSCDGVHVRTATRFGSPTAVAVANGYSDNDDCRWELNCPTGSTVRLVFTSMDTESNFDQVRVFDSLEVDSHLLGSFGGSEPPADVDSSSNTMLVQLNADSSVARDGFAATFSCVRSDPCLSMSCNEPHGICQDGQCACKHGYSGSTCTIFDPCAGVECGGASHGTCSDGTCICKGGWSGSSCETPDLCADIDCGQHGSCTGGQCTCVSGWSGSRCEVEPHTSPCDLIPQPAWCAEHHPAAVCIDAEPRCSDDDAQLLQTDAAQMVSFCNLIPDTGVCECLAAHDLCDVVRSSFVPDLDTVCGCSCASSHDDAAASEPEPECNTAPLATRAWRGDGNVPQLVNLGAGRRQLGEVDGSGVTSAAQEAIAALCPAEAQRCFESASCSQQLGVYLGDSDATGFHDETSTEFWNLLVCYVPLQSVTEADTPASQYPIYADVCTAGGIDKILPNVFAGRGSRWDFLVARTQAWFELALDYESQGASRNSEVIASQLCAETAFDSHEGLFDCLGSVPGGDTRLSDLHDDACQLATRISKGLSLGSYVDLQTNQAPSLLFDEYMHTASEMSTNLIAIADKKGSLDVQSHFINIMSEEVARQNADAQDEHQLWEDKTQEQDTQMGAYRQQIQTINGKIQRMLQQMEVDGPTLISAATDQITASQQAFMRAVGAAHLRAQEQQALHRALADLQSRQEAIQSQLDSLRADQQSQRQALLQGQSALAQQLASVEQQLRVSQAATDDNDSIETLSTLQSDPRSTPERRQEVLNGAMHAILREASQGARTFNDVRHEVNQKGATWLVSKVEEAGCDVLLAGCTVCCDGIVAVLDGTVNDWLEEKGDELLTGVEDWIIDEAGQFLHWVTGTETWGAIVQEVREFGDDVDAVRTRFDAAMDAAEDVCDTITSVGAGLAATGIPVVAQAGEVVEGVANVAGEALDFVETGVDWVADGISSAVDWISSWRRRLAEECEEMDPAVCQQMQQRLSDLEDKLQAARQLTATVTALTELNTRLSDPSSSGSEIVDCASLPRLDMTFLDLDLLNEEVMVSGISATLGSGTGQTYNTEVRQLVRLIRTKLEQTRSYYEAAIDKYSDEQYRDMLSVRAQRSSGLVHDWTNQQIQLAVTTRYLDTKLRIYSQMSLKNLVQAAHAYEYKFLTPFDGIDLGRLRARRFSGEEFMQFVDEAKTRLQDAFTDAQATFNNGGSSCYSGTSFEFSDLPAAHSNFVETGEISLTIPLPLGTNYYDVHFSDVRVFLVGTGVAADTRLDSNKNVRLAAIKAGTSVFKDRNNKAHRFTQQDSNPPFMSEYDASDGGSCRVLSHSDTRLGERQIYAQSSPYGTWHLSLADPNDLDQLVLAQVTGIQFEFNLHYSLGSFAGSNMLFVDSPGCTGELGPAACSNEQGVDKCADVHCGTHGRCSGDTGQCVCDIGWSGEGCHTVCPVDCGEHGQCAGPLGQCACDAGWYGLQCSSFDICDTVACGAHGRCHIDEAAAGGTATATCVCDSGFTGDMCADRVSTGGAALEINIGGFATWHGGLVVVAVLGIAAAKRRSSSAAMAMATITQQRTEDSDGIGMLSEPLSGDSIV